MQVSNDVSASFALARSTCSQSYDIFCECHVISAEDAVEAVKHGAAGVIVSNHGGRQLDSVPAAVGLYASRESQ